MISLLRGKTNRHKDYVYGEVTTRGIINGTDSYPIRTVRDDRFRLVWNLNPEAKYTNALTRTPAFQSMVEKAKSGDSHAQEFVRRYQHRPELELFDCQMDPLEMNNLAENPEYKATIRKLKGKLQQWMDSQGDKGIQTELDAIYRHRNAIGKTKAEVDTAWAKKNGK
jgi:uncharacterized sulfatase